MKKKPVIFFLGKSGSGKDTQAEILVKKHGLHMINSGAILRELNDKSVLSQFDKRSAGYYEIKEIQNIINSGRFVPTLTIVCQWRFPVLDIVRNPQRSKGIVFTGSPRKLAEAILLHDFFLNWADAAQHFKLFPINIKLSDKEAVKRLLARMQCVGCKKNFSTLNTGTVFAICDKCGGKLVRRKDDNRAGIKARLTEYREYTIPVVSYFKRLGNLFMVDGGRSIEAVHRDIAKIVMLK